MDESCPVQSAHRRHGRASGGWRTFLAAQAMPPRRTATRCGHRTHPEQETAVQDIGEGSARLISAEHAYLAMRQTQASTPGSNHPGMLTDGDPTEINSITKCLTDRVLREIQETLTTAVRLHLSLLEPAINKKVDERIANQSDSITVDRRRKSPLFRRNKQKNEGSEKTASRHWPPGHFVVRSDRRCIVDDRC